MGNTPQHNNFLPKLPSVEKELWMWNGDTSKLQNFLERFHRKFHVYPDRQALEFFRTCMPKRHWDDIETCHTLQEAMDKMLFGLVTPKFIQR